MAVVRRGAVAGVIGGVVMGMWSMLVMWVDGTGLWAPVNLIAHTLWRDAPLDGTFNAGALALGMAIHMMMSMLVGTMIAATIVQLRRLRQNVATRAVAALVIIVAGIGVGLIVWVVMQYGIWRVVDETAALGFTQWVFAVAHGMFGTATALVLYLVSGDERRHVAYR